MREISEIKTQVEKRKALYTEFTNSSNPELQLAGPQLMAHAEDDLRLALTASIPLDRLSAICTAEKEGRCVVLPCKVGDTVWTIEKQRNDHGTHDKVIVPHTVFEIYFDEKMRLWIRHDTYHSRIERIGQAVFLTRAEAEAAKEGQG